MDIVQKFVINELKNIHVHVFWGFWFCYFFIRITGLWYLCFLGIILGFIVELIQYLIVDKRDLRIKDRIFDCVTYVLGGCLNLFLLI